DEGTSSPVASRARSRDSPSPSEELPSPLARGKRPATRSRGQGFGSGTDGTASLHPPKRLCLSSAGGPVRLNVALSILFKCSICTTKIKKDKWGCNLLKKWQF
ncbi:hypothetical protein XENORESO_001733, partial [Xenotaenia resolanae]